MRLTLFQRFPVEYAYQGHLPFDHKSEENDIIVVVFNRHSHGGFDYSVKGCQLQPTRGFLNDEGDIYEGNIFF
jgi:hypothetical protein